MFVGKFVRNEMFDDAEIQDDSWNLIFSDQKQVYRNAVKKRKKLIKCI